MRLDEPAAILHALVAEPEPTDSEYGNFVLCGGDPPSGHEPDCVWIRADNWIRQLNEATG